jgi:hypothetical protein
MTGYEAYQQFVALKAHFTTNYDYFKYNGKIKAASADSYQNRKDKYQFEKLSKRSSEIDITKLIVSNLIINPKIWAGQLLDEKGLHNYNTTIKDDQSLYYTFTQHVQLLDKDFNSNFKVQENSHPKLFQLLISKKVNLNTCIILDDIVKYKSYWDRKMNTDIMWKQYSTLIDKYRRFVPEYEIEKYQKYILSAF